MAIQPCDEQHLRGKILRLKGHQGNSGLNVDETYGARDRDRKPHCGPYR
jgi:hypothetical protein